MRCRLFHDWTKWKNILVRWSDRNGNSLTRDAQERDCRRCGKRDRRELW